MYPEDDSSTIIKLEPLIDCVVDWGKALALPAMDSLDNYPEGFEGLPLTGAIVVRLLCYYAAIAHKASCRPDNQSLAVVVWPPKVFFCPSKNGHDGAFVQPFNKDLHGDWAYWIEVGMNIWNYSNIHAMWAGWEFNAQMIFASEKQEVANF